MHRESGRGRHLRGAHACRSRRRIGSASSTSTTDGRVTAFIEKPANPPSNLVSMGVYVFSWPRLRELLSPDRVDFGRDVLPWMVEAGRRVYAYEFGGYWQDVGTVEATGRRASTCSPTTPASSSTTSAGSSTPGARSGRRPASAQAPASSRSMISHGCVIEGTVEHSVLSPGVRVGRGRGRARLDRHVRRRDRRGRRRSTARSSTRRRGIGAGATVGVGDDLRPNRDEPERLYAGITLVGKRRASRAASRSAATAGSTRASPRRDFGTTPRGSGPARRWRRRRARRARERDGGAADRPLARRAGGRDRRRQRRPPATPR